MIYRVNLNSNFHYLADSSQVTIRKECAAPRSVSMSVKISISPLLIHAVNYESHFKWREYTEWYRQ